MSQDSSTADADDDTFRPRPGNVLFDVWLVSRAVHAVIDEAIGPSGLDADEFAIYSILASDAAMTPSGLAEWMAAPPTTVSSYVKRFERRGHIRRAPNPDDGRSYLVELTAAGREAHRDAGALFGPLLDRLDGLLADSAGQTQELLIDLRRAVDAIGDGERPPSETTAGLGPDR